MNRMMQLSKESIKHMAEEQHARRLERERQRSQWRQEDRDLIQLLKGEFSHDEFLLAAMRLTHLGLQQGHTSRMCDFDIYPGDVKRLIDEGYPIVELVDGYCRILE
ncbi:MAG: hypothetical protein IPP59_03880 [Betaproteobacteria bacterium]|nr:hypothetical protein [Candidatus Dechloromonas phosphorivorans]